MSGIPGPLAELGLQALPFPKAPARAQLFRWPGLEEAMARLHIVLDTRGIMLLTGETGCGKSTVVRAFLGELDPVRQPAVYLADSRLLPRDFYAQVLEHFGVLPARTYSAARRQFQTLMSDLAGAQEKAPVVVIDEAQGLTQEMVQELRYVQNVYCDADSPFALVLAGHSELRATLRLKVFEAVTQRITMRYHLPGLTAEQVGRFVVHGLALAGVGHPLFTEEALQLLHKHSQGLPRRVGLLATHALLDAAVCRTPLVEEASMRRAVAELEE